MKGGSNKRGSASLRAVDKWLGPAILRVLGVAVQVQRALVRGPQAASGPTIVVCFGAIGDLLLLSAVARDTSIRGGLVLACTAENRSAASIYADVFEKVEIVELKKLGSIAEIVRRYGAARLIDSTQWANVSALQIALAKLSRPALRVTGFRSRTRSRALVYDELVEHSDVHHEVLNFARLLGNERSAVGEQTFIEGEPAEGSKVALHMWPSGTRSYLKEWPRANWVELARRLHASGFELVATGGPADAERTSEFIAEANVPIENLAGAISLVELHRRFRQDIRYCVSVNTGTMHLAALAGAQVLALNGPTNPARWGPIGPYSVSLQPASGNYGYLNYGFEYPESDEDAYALDKLSVESVLAALHTMSRRHD